MTLPPEAEGGEQWAVGSSGAEGPATDHLSLFVPPSCSALVSDQAECGLGEVGRPSPSASGAEGPATGHDPGTVATEDTKPQPEGREAQSFAAEEVEAILADFRSWFNAIPISIGATATDHPLESSAPDELIDLHTLLGQFTALRHDVNLQTKATRAQQEMNAEMLRQLGQAFEGLKQAQAAARQADEERKADSLRPVLKALIEAHDALLLAEREAVRVKANLPDSTDGFAHEAQGDAAEELLALLDEVLSSSTRNEASDQTSAIPDSQSPKRTSGPIRRLFGWLRGVQQLPEDTAQQQARERLHVFRSRWEQYMQEQRDRDRSRREKLEEAIRLIDSISAGYAMSIQRLQRALDQQGLEPIPTIGHDFDPELMEVVEAVVDPDGEPGEVVGELRRGYLWHGRVFRYAQVRVVSG